jgi:hypothetical protein
MKKILEWLKALPSARAHSDGQTEKKKEAVKRPPLPFSS